MCVRLVAMVGAKLVKVSSLTVQTSLISKKIDSLNIKGALKLISTNDTLAESNLDTLIELRSKHPTTTFMIILPQPYSHCAADQEEVRKAILSFHRDSAHGLDGIRPKVLQDITSPVICTQVSILTKITNLVNKILNGDVPSFITPLLFGARLIALQKPNKDIWPIAIGSTYRRLVAKLIASRIKHDAAHILSPYQLGVGIPGGCEAAVHLTRIHIENNPKNESLVKIDFSNAYNTLSRNTFLHSTCFHFPAYTKFLFSCYQSPTSLLNKEKILSVEEQGDPLGSLLFSLGINDMIKSINSSCTLSLHAYVELTHLGSPVGGHEAISTFLHSTLDILLKLEDIFTLLPSHKSFFLLKNFFFIPRILYALRSTPIFKYPIPLQTYEKGIKDLTEKIVNIRFNETAWAQATLPTKFGGLGIRSPHDLAITTFILSSLLTKPITTSHNSKEDLSLIVAMDIWKTRINADSHPPTTHRQKDWDATVVARCVETLLSSMQSTDRTLFSSLLNGTGHEFLEAIPSTNLQLQLSNNEFTHAIGIRLNCSITHPHICSGCNSLVDSKGRHSLHCRSCNGRFIRHKQCNTIIQHALKSAQIPSTLEPQGLFRSDGKRPDGISQIPWRRGQLLVWDYSCIDPLAPSNHAINILDQKEQLKTSKYTEIMNDHCFIPIISTTLGTFGKLALAFFKNLGSQISKLSEEPREGFFLRQRLSIAILKSNYISFNGSLLAKELS
ncbi:uncharacterized protein LOC135926824 [Gordionus sp. m RMFG-2023]|uniref:uncharacterized protein LOC135926824 n=1 Tax=Gordionus sp. m RMFG-2023 TaxID=3053472 RepID=UPI0031FCAC78